MIDFTRQFSVAAFALVLLVIPACGGDPDGPSGDPAPVAASFPAGLFVDSAPDGAVGVREAIESAKSGDPVVIRGVVGGRKKAFVDSRAILIAIDAELTPCPPEEGCPTPWDYCCETPETLLANTISVQVVDADGAPLERSLRGVHGLEPLVEIVVAGTVRTAENSVVIDAEKIFVEE